MADCATLPLPTPAAATPHAQHACRHLAAFLQRTILTAPPLHTITWLYLLLGFTAILHSHTLFIILYVRRIAGSPDARGAWTSRRALPVFTLRCTHTVVPFAGYTVLPPRRALIVAAARLFCSCALHAYFASGWHWFFCHAPGSMPPPTFALGSTAACAVAAAFSYIHCLPFLHAIVIHPPPPVYYPYSGLLLHRATVWRYRACHAAYITYTTHAHLLRHLPTTHYLLHTTLLPIPCLYI